MPRPRSQVANESSWDDEFCHHRLDRQRVVGFYVDLTVPADDRMQDYGGYGKKGSTCLVLLSGIALELATILELLPQLHQSTFLRLLIFLTCRPETASRLGLMDRIISNT